MADYRQRIIADVLRLRDIDARLRNGGVNVPSLAAEFGVAIRTIQRCLAVLREIVGPTASIEEILPGIPPVKRFRQVYRQPAKLFFVVDAKD